MNNDEYFLGKSKTKFQWYLARDEFEGAENLSEDEWFMASDYLFRLSVDYIAYVSNTKMRPEKKEERIGEVVNCAETFLSFAGLKVKT